MVANNHARHFITISIAAAFFLTISLIARSSSAAAIDNPVYALYIPPHKITQRTIDEIVHYAGQTPVNAVVMHVKTPRGTLLWPSKNELAIQLGVGSNHVRLEKQLSLLKKANIHTIAKLDVFADHQLSGGFPELSLIDRNTSLPWSDANGLHWPNPSDPNVWNYNISLAAELAHLGFDEIQFDYIRFPSDGDLSAICYTNAMPVFSKSDIIASFLEKAYGALKPLGVSISADIFGLTAWKANDFGVGQVLEKMAPYLDVICPMFYPSHFPVGFLGKQKPGDFPEMIMETSMRSIMKRTKKPIRPWIQGFWYRSEQIIAQIDGIENASGNSWSIWSPTGRYELAYDAIAQRSGTQLSRPQFYPPVEALRVRNDHTTWGNRNVVNYTNFNTGYTILSLEAPEKGMKSCYSSPATVLATLEEGIMDHILRERAIPFNPDCEPYIKRKLLGDLLCNDLETDARRMRPEPIYIDWSQNCVFASKGIPQSRLDAYATVSRHPIDQDIAIASSSEAINIASISESIFGITVPYDFNQPSLSVAQ